MANGKVRWLRLDGDLVGVVGYNLSSQSGDS